MPLWGYVYFLKGFNLNAPLKNLETKNDLEQDW